MESRTISITPTLTMFVSQELDAPSTDAKDRRAPAKKNRISAQLDSTQEEEEQSGEGTITLVAYNQGTSSSPPTESKIRQISQGVEDITWRNIPKPATPDIERTEPDTQHTPMDAEQSIEAAEEPVVPPLMRGENPPLVIDNAGEDEHAGDADPAEVPPDAQSEEEATPPPDSVIQFPKKDVPSLSRRGSDESVDHERGLKRKMGDRSVSERKVPGDLVDVKSGTDSKLVAAAKRPRDDDTDTNPRETKRPTPPPDEDEPVAGPSAAGGRQTPPNAATQTQPSGTSTPKVVRMIDVNCNCLDVLMWRRAGSCHTPLPTLPLPL